MKLRLPAKSKAGPIVHAAPAKQFNVLESRPFGGGEFFVQEIRPRIRREA